MPSTTQHPKGQAPKQYRDVDPVAQAITEKMLNHRSTLPRGLNGRAAAQSTPQVAQLRKHCRQGLSTPVRHMLNILADDVRCGVPVETVVGVLDDMKAFLVLCAGDLTPTPREFLTLNIMEQRADSRVDVCQNVALARPGNAEALAELSRALDDYNAVAARLSQNVRAQLMVVRTDAPRYEVVRS